MLGDVTTSVAFVLPVTGVDGPRGLLRRMADLVTPFSGRDSDTVPRNQALPVRDG